MDNEENKHAEPTLQELKEFWLAHRQKEQELQSSVSDSQPRPTVGTDQEQRPHKSYESCVQSSKKEEVWQVVMKRLW